MPVDYARFQLAPDTTGFTDRLSAIFQQNRAEKKLNERQEEVEGLSKSVLEDGEGADEAMARIVSIDPQAGAALTQIAQRRDARSLARAQQAADERSRLATDLLSIKEPTKRQSAIISEVQKRQAEGKQINDLIEIANISDPQMQTNALRKQQMLAYDAKDYAERQLGALNPEYSTFKETDSGGLIGVTKQGRAAPIDLGGQRLRDKTPRQEVNVFQQAEKAERIETAKVRAKQYERLSEEVDAAQNVLDNLNQLENIDVESGALEPIKANFAAVIEGLGVDASAIANVDNAQAFDAVSGRLLNDVLNAAKGPQTDEDAKRVKKTIASLGDSAGAQRFKIKSAKALALRKTEEGAFIEQRMDGGQTYSQARAEWNRHKNKNPMVSSLISNPETGLPVFYYEFRENARMKRPDITEEEIQQAWSKAHGR